FGAGAVTGATQNTTFDPSSDTLVEGDETVTLTLGVNSGVVTLGGQTTNLVTITDADVATIVVVSGQSVAEDGGAQAINVRFTSAGNTLESSLTVSVSAAAAVGTEGADATFGVLGSVTFLPNDASGISRTVNF